ncbi:MAG: hypothetical protein KME04_15180 [Pleurocapsa minor GSE-CHR-MK-17-07R]|jgi:hypothetical protein|nr:hypothetical protein [Pleurocapsa minor GSE-CHR-MK 17-07R]
MWSLQLTLDIVQDSSGIPANFVIQPDIQHTYLRAGQSLEIAFIPLDLSDAEPVNVSAVQSSAPSLMALAGPYRVTARARSTTIPNVTLRDGTLSNTCGADGSDRTIAAECTTPAGSETRIIGDWYCTNRPNIDIPVSLALPNGGLGVPITSVTAGANFSPGGGVYTHSTTVSLNGSVVGSAIVPSISRIENSLAPQSLILGGSSPTQLLSLRSTHTNGTHYTVASGFTVTVEYDEHTRTGCFTQAEVDAAAGGALMCTPSSVLVVPEQELELQLLPAEDEQLLQNTEGAYIVPEGREITLNAQIQAVGIQNITEPVTIELTVPDGISPRGMTIQDEDQTFLDILFDLLNAVNPDLAALANDILGIDIANAQTIFTYELESDLVIGQPFPITLDVIGERAGDFQVAGRAFIELTDVSDAEPLIASFSASSSPNLIEATAAVVLRQTDASVICQTQLNRNNTANATLRSEPDSSSAAVNTAPVQLTPGYSIIITGIFTNEAGDLWYAVIDPANGWLSGTLIDSSPPCVRALPPVNAQNEPIPMPGGNVCAAYTAFDFTNVREQPSTESAQLYTIGPRPSASAYWLRILARTLIQESDGETWYWGEAEGLSAGYVRADAVRLMGEPCLDLPIRIGGLLQPPPPTGLFNMGLNLPEPFANLPFSADTTLDFTQGYGLNTLAYSRPDFYDETNQIHSGLDFFGKTALPSETCFPESDCIHLVAVCSGTVVAPLAVGNGSTGLASGPGLTIRCDNRFGFPSNIVVTYNHLHSLSLELPDGINPLDVDTRVRAGQSLNVRAHQQPLDARDRESVIIDAHLHLEILYTPSNTGGVTPDAVRLNPLYFFTSQALAEFIGIMRPYYPVYNDSNPSRVLRFEWEPYDTTDAPPRSTNELPVGILQGQEPDTDLGIRIEENTRLYVFADVRPPVTGVPDIWARIDRSGIQDLQTETIDIPVDASGVSVLYLDLRRLLLALLGT